MLVSNPLRRAFLSNACSSRFLSSLASQRFLSTKPQQVDYLRSSLRHEPLAVTPLELKAPPLPPPVIQTTTQLSDGPRVSVLMELTDRVGVLHDVLRFFWKYDVNASRIESRPVQDGPNKRSFDFFVDFDGQRGDENVELLLASLEEMTDKLLILDEKEVSMCCCLTCYTIEQQY